MPEERLQDSKSQAHRVNKGTIQQNQSRDMLIAKHDDCTAEMFITAARQRDMVENVDWEINIKGAIEAFIDSQYKRRMAKKYQEFYMETNLIHGLTEDLYRPAYRWSAGRDIKGKSDCTVFGLIDRHCFVSSPRLKVRCLEVYAEWLGSEKKYKEFTAGNGSSYVEPLISNTLVCSWFTKGLNGAYYNKYKELVYPPTCVYKSTKLPGSQIWFRIDESQERGKYGKLLVYFPHVYLEPYGLLMFRPGEAYNRASSWVKETGSFADYFVDLL